MPVNKFGAMLKNYMISEMGFLLGPVGAVGTVEGDGVGVVL
jgi:hypothetical protein